MDDISCPVLSLGVRAKARVNDQAIRTCLSLVSEGRISIGEINIVKFDT